MKVIKKIVRIPRIGVIKSVTILRTEEIKKFRILRTGRIKKCYSSKNRRKDFF